MQKYSKFLNFFFFTRNEPLRFLMTIEPTLNPFYLVLMRNICPVLTNLNQIGFTTWFIKHFIVLYVFDVIIVYSYNKHYA